MPAPSLAIDLDAIAQNTAAIVARAHAAGIGVIGVTKATGGSPPVARAMLRGGVTGFGESRIDNVRRLRNAGITQPITMLRIPSVSEAADVVRWCDISLNSEERVLRALSQAAVEAGRVHGVVVMLEMGDRREGVTADELMPMCDLALALPGIRFAGLGANFMCASGVLPSEAKLRALADQVEAVEARFGVRLDVVSGGNSANLAMLEAGQMPARINQLRIGASILRGEEPISGGFFPWLRPDAFTLQAELVEMKVKPSLPEGETGFDAFGNRPVFADRGNRVRGIVNLGRVDIRLEGLSPREADLEITTASSDHLIVDLTGARRFAVGDAMAFGLDYGALVQAYLSPYVEKRLAGRAAAQAARRVRLLADPVLAARAETQGFLATLRDLGYQTEIGGPLGEDDLPLRMPPDRDPAWAQITADLPDRSELGLLWLDSCPGPSLNADPESLALVGLRQASRAEAARIAEAGILALTMEDIDLTGIREAMRRALARVTAMTEGFVLSLDASVGRGMEPDDLEAGLSYRECSTAMELVAASGALRGIVMTGFDPDARASALEAAYGYLLSALGKRILGQREAS
jgi:predicted amino acid racemase